MYRTQNISPDLKHVRLPSVLTPRPCLAPVQVKEVYLAHLLGNLAEHKVRSVMIFSSTCKGCHLLSIILEQLGLRCAALHSGEGGRTLWLCVQGCDGCDAIFCRGCQRAPMHVEWAVVSCLLS